MVNAVVNLADLPEGDAASLLGVSAAGGAVRVPASNFVEDTDPRLSDARPPADHNHAVSDVDGLQAALEAKFDKSGVDGLQAALDAKFDKSGGSLAGDLNITGSGRKITADMTSAPGRMVVQNNIPNQGSILTVVPNGTANSAQTNAHSSLDWLNSTFSRSGVAGTEVFHTGSSSGAGAPCSVYRWGPSLSVNWTMDALGRVRGPSNGVAPFASRVSVTEATTSTNWTNAALSVVAAGGAPHVDIGLASNGGGNAALLRFAGSDRIKFLSWDAGAYHYAEAGTAGAGETSNVLATTAWVRTLHASDSRIKSDLMPVGGTLEKLSGITAYTYKQQGYEARKLGSIAQAWQKHWPDATPEITYEGEQRLSIDPLAAIAILTQALNELHDKVKRLEAAQ